jgi:membrane protease subunit HflK
MEVLMDAIRLTQDNPWGDSASNTSKSNVQDIFSTKSKKKGGGFRGPNLPTAIHISPFWVLLSAAILWLASGFYQIEPYEQGLVLRFGEWVRTSEQGIHYHLPFPFERVITVDVTSTRKLEIGFRNPNESHMLTGDRNIVDVSVIVQWNIKDAEKYVFSIHNPKSVIKAATESALREVVGKTPIDTTITSGRSEIQAKTKFLVQKILDAYASGIHVSEVNLDQVNPPEEVIESFRAVEKAEAYQKQVINQAESYRNNIVPKARGQAAQIREKANGYKQAAIARAKGDVSYFDALSKEHKKHPKLLENRMYFETMEKVLKNANKVIVNGSNTNLLPHMKLPAIKERS